MASGHEAQRAQPVVGSRADQTVAKVEQATQVLAVVQQVHGRVLTGEQHGRTGRQRAFDKRSQPGQQVNRQAGAPLTLGAAPALIGKKLRPVGRQLGQTAQWRGLNLGHQLAQALQQGTFLILGQAGLTAARVLTMPAPSP